MNQYFKKFTQTFLRGVIVLLPILLSAYLLLWLAGAFDGFFRIFFFPFPFYEQIPFGIGLLLGVALVTTVGFFSEYLVGQYLGAWVERWIRKIPVVRTLFRSLKDIIDYFKALRGPDKHGRAVLITLSNLDFKIAGFLTRDDLSDLPTTDDLYDRVAVYIPLAYMVGGGFTLFVRKDQVHDLDMPFEQAMRLSITAWMTHANDPIATAAQLKNQDQQPSQKQHSKDEDAS